MSHHRDSEDDFDIPIQDARDVEVNVGAVAIPGIHTRKELEDIDRATDNLDSAAGNAAAKADTKGAQQDVGRANQAMSMEVESQANASRSVSKAADQTIAGNDEIIEQARKNQEIIDKTQKNADQLNKNKKCCTIM